MDRLTVLKNLGFSPRTILDIGAHEGNWGKEIHGIWPMAQIFMVEANEDCRKHLAGIDWLKGYAIALLGHKEKGKAKYFVSNKQYTTGNSVYKEQTHYFDSHKVRQLPMVTLDSIVKKHCLEKIDFIKIDTQGSELAIIKGGEQTISSAQFVLLEMQNLEYNLGAPDVFRVLQEMKRRGFSLFDITEIHRLPSGEMMQFDALFAKKNSCFVKKSILW